MNKTYLLIFLTMSIFSCRERQEVSPLVGASSVSEGVDDNINEINLIIDAPAPISTDYTYNTPDYALADVVGSVKNVVTTEVSARKDNDDADKLVPQMQNVTNVYYSDFSNYGVTITSYHEINNIGINLSNYPETREAICCFLNNPNSSKSENKDTKGRVTERRFRQQLKGESACQELVIRYEWEENRIVMIRCQMKGLETVEIFEYNDEGYMIKATCNENVLGSISVTTTKFVYTRYDANLNWLERNMICITTNKNVTRSSYYIQTRVISYYELSVPSSYGDNNHSIGNSPSISSDYADKCLYFDETIQLKGVFHAVRQPDDPSNPFSALARFYEMTLSVSPLTVCPLPSATKPEYKTATNIRIIYLSGYGTTNANKIEEMDGRTVTVTGRLFPNPKGTGQVGMRVDKIEY